MSDWRWHWTDNLNYYWIKHIPIKYKFVHSYDFIIYCLLLFVRYRIFHSYRDVTIADEGLQKLVKCSELTFFERGKAGLYRVIPAMTRDLSLRGLVWRTTTINHLWTSQGSWGHIPTRILTEFGFMKFVQLAVTKCNHFAIHSSEQFRNTLNVLVAVRVTTSSPPPSGALCCIYIKDGVFFQIACK